MARKRAKTGKKSDWETTKDARLGVVEGKESKGKKEGRADIRLEMKKKAWALTGGKKNR